MRSAALSLILIGLAAVPLGAQGRGRGNNQGIPPGQMPGPGLCRVWYDGRPPGQQPPATNCDNAERIAARDPYARVIYGDRVTGPNGDRVIRPSPRGPIYRNPDDQGPYSSRYPRDRFPNGGYGYATVPFDNGYQDGYDKGREDARDNDRYDPSRHSRYRSGDRGYNQRYGTRAEYQNVYRDGFRAGYEDGFRGAGGPGATPRRSGRWPW
jgi:hypothetical protein